MGLLSHYQSKELDVIHLRPVSACVLLFLYLLLCYETFIATSGGWYAVGYYSLGIIGITIVFVVFIAGLLLRRILKGKSSLFINTNWMKLVFCLQIGATIFNIGDCGDREGSYTFITAILTRFLGRQEICAGSAPLILVVLFFSFFASYIVIFLAGFVMILFQTPSMTEVSDY